MTSNQDEYGHQWEADEERQGPEGQVDHLRCVRCEVPSDDERAEQECAGEPQEGEILSPADMGLRDYDLHDEDRACPKCGFSQMQVIYHARVVITVGEGQDFPCGAWVLAGILSEHTTQHLCQRCLRCGYGYPTKTADAA